MPPSDTQDERRGGKLLTVLFWAGVGLAPLAALLLLVGQGEGPLRVAAVLAVLAVVLIGLSITLRRDSDSVRLELEETLLDEIDLLREDVRVDITTAARATHRAFGEKLQALHDSLEAMRGQVEEAARAGLPRGGYGSVESRASPSGPPAVTATASANGSYQQSVPRVAQHSGIPAGAQSGAAAGIQPGVAVAGVAMPTGGRVRHTETVHVTTRQTIVDQHSGDVGRANGYGDVSGYQDAGRPDPYGDPRTGGHTARAAGVSGAAHNRTAEPLGAVRPSSAMPSSAMPSSAMPSSAMPSSAMPSSGMPSSGMPGGSRHGDWSGQSRGWAPQHGEASWSDHRQREQAPDPQSGGVYSADPRLAEARPSPETTQHRTRAEARSAPEARNAAEARSAAEARGAAEAPRPRPHEASGEEGWSDVRAGDRWASVRTDDRGREMRMGERRAAVHTDQSGTELRVEDRWASVRQQEPRQQESRQEPRWEDQQRSWEDQQRSWEDQQRSWEEPRRDERRHDEAPRSGSRSEGRPAEGRPAEGRPAESRPAESRPAESRPAEGRRAAPRQHADEWTAQPAAQWTAQPAAQWTAQPAAQWSGQPAAQWSQEPQAAQAQWSQQPQAAQAQWSQQPQAGQWSQQPQAAQWSQEHQAVQWSQEHQAGRGQEAAWSQSRREQERVGGQPALPASPAEPANGWSQGWAQPDHAPAGGGRRRRAESEEDQYGYRIAQPDGPPPARAARRVDFELSDERWR